MQVLPRFPPELVAIIIRDAVILAGSDSSSARVNEAYRLSLVHSTWTPFAQQLLFTAVASGSTRSRVVLDAMRSTRVALTNWTTSFEAGGPSGGLFKLLEVTAILQALPHLVQLSVRLKDPNTGVLASHDGFDVAPGTTFPQLRTLRIISSWGSKLSSLKELLSFTPNLTSLAFDNFSDTRKLLDNVDLEAGDVTVRLTDELAGVSTRDSPELKLEYLSMRLVKSPFYPLPFSLTPSTLKHLVLDTVKLPSETNSIANLITPHANTLEVLSLSDDPIRVAGTMDFASSPLVANLIQKTKTFPKLTTLTLRSAAISIPPLRFLEAPQLRTFRLLDSQLSLPYTHDPANFFFRREHIINIVAGNYFESLKHLAFESQQTYVYLGGEFTEVCKERGIDNFFGVEEARRLGGWWKEIEDLC